MEWVCALVVAVLAPNENPFIIDPEPPPAQVEKTTAKAPPPSDRVIDLSELDELRAEVKALKEENVKLLKKVNELTDAQAEGNAPPPKPPAAAGAKAAPAPPRRNYSRIEVGMTRADVDRYIGAHRNLKLISVSANSGVTAVTDETVTHRQGTTGTTVVRRGGTTGSRNLGPGFVDDSQVVDNGEQKEVVQRRQTRGKREVLTIANMVSTRVQTGTERNSLGGSSPVYGHAMRESGRLRIEMTDDVVTAIDGVQN